MIWDTWFDKLFTVIMAIVIGVLFAALCWIVIDRRNNPRLYTVKHGESIHRGTQIGIDESGVINGIDAQGRKFYYRDGWEAVQEVPK